MNAIFSKTFLFVALFCAAAARADFEVFLMRHGETSWNRAKILQGSVSCTSLTPRGVDMAERSAEGLVREGVRFDRIYSSPYRRARQTAGIVAKAMGLEPTDDLRIREMCFGEYEGRHYAKGAYPDENLRLFFEDPERYEPKGPGAESFAQVGARVRDFLEHELVPQDGRLTRVLCVTHTLVLKALLRELFGDNVPETAKSPIQKNCCVHVLRYADGKFELKDVGRVFYDPAEFDARPMPRVVAHRGAGDLTMPEGSLSAYSNAVETVCDIVKLDLRKTKDGVPVLSHDPTLKRTMGWNARIDELDYAGLLAQGRFKLKGRDTGERIVRLDQALQIVRPVPEFWLDFKHFDPAFAERVLSDVKAAGIDESRLMVATFNRSALSYFKSHHPLIRRVAHVGAQDPVGTALQLRDELGLFGVNMPVAKDATRPEDVVRLQKAGLWVSLWFVQRAGQAENYPMADAYVSDRVSDVRLARPRAELRPVRR